MSEKLHLSVSPHIHSGRSTTKIMLDVLIALLPTTVAGTIIFGWRALAVIAVCVGTSLLSEFLFNLIAKKKQTLSDLSAVVTGLLLALNLPSSIPLWQAAVGSIFAIIIVKCIFGGIGKNLVNPAMTARVFMILSFGKTMSTYPKSNLNLSFLPSTLSSSATPLAKISEKELFMSDIPDLLLGNHGGCIGEVCAVALIIGFVYLLVRKVITWHIPVTFVASAFVLTFLLGGFSAQSATLALAGILSGGLLLGAIFMATDYVTSPSTAWGKIIFALGAAVITVLIRVYGIYPEGVSYAILLMNILSPYIESLTSRKLFGVKKANEGGNAA